MTDQPESRILIVDDIEENLMVLTDTLEAEGFHPLQAMSGERAVQIAAAARPDLILLDIKMPGMDGYETINALKARPETADIPVIFISALGQIDDKVKGFRAGAVDYVSKPFQKEEVVARVGTHLRLRSALRAVELERAKSDRLLLNILPEAVASELKEKGQSEPVYHAEASALFADIVGFTQKAALLSPKEVVAELNEIFTGFDAITARSGCERIKTIGDAYFAVCGIPRPESDHAFVLARAAQDMIAWLAERNSSGARTWEVRVGIHSGDAMAGIVGTCKYLYDVFGDTVNVASRMESASLPMRVNVSRATADRLGGRLPLEPRGPLEVKGKGVMEMYFLA
jgi:class 3 adenylate cyclase